MDAVDGELRHYHDKTGLECDAVLQDWAGNYALDEIKLGGDSPDIYMAGVVAKKDMQWAASLGLKLQLFIPRIPIPSPNTTGKSAMHELRFAADGLVLVQYWAWRRSVEFRMAS